MNSYHSSLSLLRTALAALATLCLAASCSLVHDDDLPPCAQGIDLYFKYDYNLERADMFRDHVGGVSVYLYDESGQFIRKYTDAKNGQLNPFKADGYHLHMELPEGRYQYIVLAHQRDYAETLVTPGAKQRTAEPVPGAPMTDLVVSLDHDEAVTVTPTGGREVTAYAVSHQGLPLDTLWHGMSARPLDVVFEKVTRDTVSLTRDTKQINVTLRDVELPSDIDVADYDMRILDKNARILYDNAVDEATPLLYTPYRTWNTTDRIPAPGRAAAEGAGRMAHADFMTSRILWHEHMADDATLSVTNRVTGVEVIRVNLADLLSRLRTSADLYRYSNQEFLDRGYDYKLTFFLQGDRWKYVNVEISVLGWAKRVQCEDL